MKITACNQYEKKVPYINARCAIAVDAKTGIVLYEKNSDMIVPMASATKIITALVALKYGNLEKKIIISEKAANINGSTAGYRKGEEITLRELLYGLMLRSGNDAAIAIAEGVAGSVEEFCLLMGEFAHELGYTNTNFKTPHGLDKENHYTTAYDLAMLTSKAKEIKEFNDIVSTKDIDASQFNFTRSYHNINKILWKIPKATGVKTGYTGQAGKCLVTSVKQQDREVIIVVLNSPGRWKETEKIYNFICDEYEYVKIASKGEVVHRFKPDKSKNIFELKTYDEIILPVKKNSTIDKKIVVDEGFCNTSLTGENLGSIVILEDDKELFRAKLQVNYIKKGLTFKKWFSRILK
jgi:serine-type D-Ala-D-Ala carboxypeptidase (penicillin-binding protein 5/6)